MDIVRNIFAIGSKMSAGGIHPHPQFPFLEFSPDSVDVPRGNAPGDVTDIHSPSCWSFFLTATTPATACSGFSEVGVVWISAADDRVTDVADPYLVLGPLVVRLFPS